MSIPKKNSPQRPVSQRASSNSDLMAYDWLLQLERRNYVKYSFDNYCPQIPGNLSLPGGFKLGGYGNQYCDVVTATGIVLNLSLVTVLVLFLFS